jgi:hypothetical protein
LSQDTIDWEKVREFQERAEEYDREQEKKRRLFDPKELVKKSRKIKTAQDPELGLVSFGELVFSDLAEINVATTNEQKSVLILYKMLQKAYPDVAVEDVRSFGLADVTRLLKLMMGPDFLQVTAKPSPDGSKTTVTFKGSDS